MSTSGRMVVDLRALVIAGVAASPLYLWSLVDLAGWYGAWIPTREIILEMAFESVQLLLTSVGLVAVTVGSALLLRRDRAEPIAFTMTALAVVTLFVVVDAIVLGLSMMRREVSADVNASYYVVTEIVRYTANFAVVALAARLYVGWSSAGPDALETRRSVALGVVVAVLASVSTLIWISVMLSALSQIPDEVSTPVAVLQGFQHLLWSLVSAAGPVFLFGWVAIHAVRQQQREHSVGALVFAGSCAAVVYALLVYGRAFGRTALQDPSLVWPGHTAIDYNPLIGAAFAGVGGAIIYAFAIDGAALSERLRALPSTILSLRNRPLYAPDEDVER